MTDDTLTCPKCGSTKFRCLQWVTQVQDYDAVADSWGDFEHTDHIEALEFDISCAACEENCDEAWVAAGHTLYTDPEPQSREEPGLPWHLCGHCGREFRPGTTCAHRSDVSWCRERAERGAS